MKILKNTLLVILVAIIALAAIGMFLPREYKVERSVVIQAPVDVVFDQVNDLKKNEAWSPWDDPTMVITYSAVTVGEGASSHWTSQDMGNGSQTIEESVTNQSIRTHLDFGSMGTAKAHWYFVPNEDGIKTTQAMTGDQGLNPFKRYFTLMVDKMIGPQFEKGLAALKAVSEAKASEMEMENLLEPEVE